VRLIGVATVLVSSSTGLVSGLPYVVTPILRCMIPQGGREARPCEREANE
jgi:hypothetical protein